MSKDELLLFKHWDSDRTKPARTCFHTAFNNPNAGKDVPVRESIEVRAYAYFPDHKPNTCPPLTETAKVADVSDTKATAQKVLRIFDRLDYWPAYAKEWLKT